MCFDFFRINVLPRTEDDDFFLATRDKEIAVAIEVPKVSGVQPAIAKDFGGCVRAIPIALHYDWAENGDLSNRWAIFLGLRVANLGLYRRQRLAPRPHKHHLRGPAPEPPP